jgi:pimeloyl-ACP methyl ester carboxylesterase
MVFRGDTAARFSGSVGFALTYLPLPFLVLGAIAWGARGATLATFVLAAITVLYSERGEGPFGGIEGFLGEGALEVQGYVAAAALLTLMVTALQGSRQRALWEAAEWRVRYEAVIAANDQLLFELDPVSGRLDWAGDTLRLLGRAPEQINTLACVREVDRLRQLVTTGLERVACQTLVVHAREDELTSLRSANFLVRGVGGDRARMVVLENSYHMICIDNDRELVARNVLEFFGVPPLEAGQLSDDPKMSAQALRELVARVCAVLEAGAWRDVPPLGIPDMSWYQPGRNRLSGIHRGGKPLCRFLGEIQSGAEGPHLTAFGTVVLNRGVALVPATWVARRAETQLASQGALMIAMHADRVYELRWFPDDQDIEDAFWMHTLPEPADASPGDGAAL